MLGQALHVDGGCWNSSSIRALWPMCTWSEFHKQAQSLAGSWAACKHLYPSSHSFWNKGSVPLCCCELWDLLSEIGKETYFNLFLNVSSSSFLYHFMHFLLHTSDEAQWLRKFSSQGRKWERTILLRAAKGSLEQAQCEFSHFGEENPKKLPSEESVQHPLLRAPGNPLAGVCD